MGEREYTNEEGELRVRCLQMTFRAHHCLRIYAL